MKSLFPANFEKQVCVEQTPISFLPEFLDVTYARILTAQEIARYAFLQLQWYESWSANLLNNMLSYAFAYTKVPFIERMLWARGRNYATRKEIECELPKPRK